LARFKQLLQLAKAVLDSHTSTIAPDRIEVSAVMIKNREKSRSYQEGHWILNSWDHWMWRSTNWPWHYVNRPPLTIRHWRERNGSWIQEEWRNRHPAFILKVWPQMWVISDSGWITIKPEVLLASENVRFW